jgi:hypothetical protein
LLAAYLMKKLMEKNTLLGKVRIIVKIQTAAKTKADLV